MYVSKLVLWSHLAKSTAARRQHEARPRSMVMAAHPVVPWAQSCWHLVIVSAPTEVSSRSVPPWPFQLEARRTKHAPKMMRGGAGVGIPGIRVC